MRRDIELDASIALLVSGIAMPRLNKHFVIALNCRHSQVWRQVQVTNLERTPTAILATVEVSLSITRSDVMGNTDDHVVATENAGREKMMLLHYAVVAVARVASHPIRPHDGKQTLATLLNSLW
jgi:hypothetical protein